jgi:hypothetical protein
MYRINSDRENVSKFVVKSILYINSIFVLLKLLYHFLFTPLIVVMTIFFKAYKSLFLSILHCVTNFTFKIGISSFQSFKGGTLILMIFSPSKNIDEKEKI